MPGRRVVAKCGPLGRSPFLEFRRVVASQRKDSRRHFYIESSFAFLFPQLHGLDFIENNLAERLLVRSGVTLRFVVEEGDLVAAGGGGLENELSNAHTQERQRGWRRVSTVCDAGAAVCRSASPPAQACMAPPHRSAVSLCVCLTSKYLFCHARTPSTALGDFFSR